MEKQRKEKQYLCIETRNELDKRFNGHQNEVGQSFTWDETLTMAKELQKLKPHTAKLAKF
jgi:hypothetical protein